MKERVEGFLKDFNLKELEEVSKVFKDTVKELKVEKEQDYVSKVIDHLKGLSEDEEHEITCSYKDGTITGILGDLRDKTFTLLIEDDFGDLKKLPRNYNSVILDI